VIFALEEHFQAGLSVLRQIEDLALDMVPEPRVCFHFRPSNSVDGRALGYGVDASYWTELKEWFEGTDIDGFLDGSCGEFGFEVWEMTVPDEPWMTTRVPEMMALAGRLQHELQGWTFEPKNGPILSAAPEIRVMDGNSDEGRLSMAKLLSSLADQTSPKS
jgi:hypothetical protein